MEGRKALVLKEIVDRYIKDGRPVSSQALLETPTPGLSVSSATIRNDMKALEQEGYITKPYSSAGRVPTEKGYRFFADWLLELGEVVHQESFSLMESFEFRRQEINGLLQRTAFLLANITGLMGFVLTPRLEEARLKYISLLRLDERTVLAVVVSDLGLIESRFIPAALSDDQLQEINALLKERLLGRSLEEIRQQVGQFFEAEGAWVTPLIRAAFNLLNEVIDTRTAQRLYLEGVLNLLRRVLDEETRPEETRRLMALLEDEGRLASALPVGDEHVQALIGSENALPELRRYSLVAMGYGYSGVLGVLGPIRMDYAKALSATQYVGNRLKAILTLSGQAPGREAESEAEAEAQVQVQEVPSA